MSSVNNNSPGFMDNMKDLGSGMLDKVGGWVDNGSTPAQRKFREIILASGILLAGVMMLGFVTWGGGVAWGHAHGTPFGRIEQLQNPSYTLLMSTLPAIAIIGGGMFLLSRAVLGEKWGRVAGKVMLTVLPILTVLAGGGLMYYALSSGGSTVNGVMNLNFWVGAMLLVPGTAVTLQWQPGLRKRKSGLRWLQRDRNADAAQKQEKNRQVLARRRAAKPQPKTEDSNINPFLTSH